MVKNNKLMMLLTFVGLLIIVAGCGGKSQESVVNKIQKTLDEMNGYKLDAQMMMKTGQEERNYEIEVWYKKGQEDFYRVGLENEDSDGAQVILKNEEGVFVLTPALNKSFKFQTEWPENSSQPYLYQSLVFDVLHDSGAEFTTEDEHYVFLTKTNYQNSTNLPFQQVYFNKKTYLPSAVKILDKDKNTLVEVVFHSIEMNPVFQEDDFDRSAILQNVDTEETMATMEQMDDLEVLYPTETLGAELIEKEEVDLEEGKRIIMTFKGARNFSLIQEKVTAVPTLTDSVQEVNGEMVHLGFAIGAMTSHGIEWNYHGTNYYLASEDLTMEELIEVASSVQGQEAK